MLALGLLLLPLDKVNWVLSPATMVIVSIVYINYNY